MSITHSKVSAKSDGGDTTLVRPSDWNAAHTGEPNAHACRIRRTTNQSIGNNTLTVVSFDAEDYDTDTMHDNSTDPTRITIPTLTGVTTGLWRVWATGYTDSALGRTDVEFKINGTTFIGGSLNAQSTGFNGYQGFTEYVLSGADYIECFLRQSGGAANVISDTVFSPIFGATFQGKVT